MYIFDHFLHYFLPVTLATGASGNPDALAIGISAGLVNSVPDIAPVLWALACPRSPSNFKGPLGIPMNRQIKLLLHEPRWFNALWIGHVNVDLIYHSVEDWFKDQFLRNLAICFWAGEAILLAQCIILLA